MEDERVAGGRASHQPFQPLPDAGGRGTFVGQQLDVRWSGETVLLAQGLGDQKDVVHAPFKVVARVRVTVQPDEERFP
jgi:hypothetical protein